MSEPVVEPVTEAAEVEAEGGTTVVVNEAPPEPEPEAEGGDTTTVVVTPEGGDPEAAVQQAAALDHEQRITRLEDVAVFLGREVEQRPTREEVAATTPSHGDVIDTAAAVAEDVVEAHQEADATGDPQEVRVPEPEGGGDPVLGTVTPDTQAAQGGDSESKPKARHAMFKW